MGIIYSIEFFLNQLTGYYYIRDPSGLLTPILVFAIMGVTALSIVTLFKKYRQTNEQSTLSWALSLFFIELALVFITIENISYTVLGQPDFGRLFSVMAISCIIFGVINLDNFALGVTYPTHKNKLVLIVAVLGIISIILILIANILGPPYAEVRGFLLVYDLGISYFVLAYVVPNFFVGPTIFFYFAGLPILAAYGISFGVIILEVIVLGVFLGAVSKENKLIYALKILPAALLVAGLTYLLEIFL